MRPHTDTETTTLQRREKRLCVLSHGAVVRFTTASDERPATRVQRVDRQANQAIHLKDDRPPTSPENMRVAGDMHVYFLARYIFKPSIKRMAPFEAIKAHNQMSYTGPLVIFQIDQKRAERLVAKSHGKHGILGDFHTRTIAFCECVRSSEMIWGIGSFDLVWE